MHAYVIIHLPPYHRRRLINILNKFYAQISLHAFLFLVFVSFRYIFFSIIILVCYVCGGLANVCVCLDLIFMWILSFCFAVRLDMLAFRASPFKTSSCRIFCRKLPNQTWNMTIVWAPRLLYVYLCVCLCVGSSTLYRPLTCKRANSPQWKHVLKLTTNTLERDICASVCLCLWVCSCAGKHCACHQITRMVNWPASLDTGGHHRQKTVFCIKAANDLCLSSSSSSGVLRITDSHRHHTAATQFISSWNSIKFIE